MITAARPPGLLPTTRTSVLAQTVFLKAASAIGHTPDVPIFSRTKSEKRSLLGISK